MENKERNIQLLPAYDYSEEIGSLFTEYTAMLIEGDPEIKSEVCFWRNWNAGKRGRKFTCTRTMPVPISFMSTGDLNVPEKRMWFSNSGTGRFR